jgi:hypothetical protein
MNFNKAVCMKFRDNCFSVQNIIKDLIPTANFEIGMPVFSSMLPLKKQRLNRRNPKRYFIPSNVTSDNALK